MARIVVAFFVAPLIGTFVGAIAAFLVFHHGPILQLGVIYLFLAYPVALVGGIPLVVFFRRWHIESLWAYVAGGVCCALAAWLFVARRLNALHLDSDDARTLLIAVLAGTAGGGAFWLIAVCRNVALTTRSRADAP